MVSTKILPSSYILQRNFNLSKERSLLIILNIAGLILLFPAAWFFFSAAKWLRILTGKGPYQSSISSTAGFLLLSLLVIISFVVLHELVHGLFFFIFTLQRPIFGFKGVYAFAAAPDWYIPKAQYCWIGVSPLVIISILGLILVPFTPDSLLLPLLIGLIFNAIGAVGDLYIVFWLFLQPANRYIQDQGDVIRIFAPQSIPS
jgi:hypothetical protein